MGAEILPPFQVLHPHMLFEFLHRHGVLGRGVRYGDWGRGILLLDRLILLLGEQMMSMLLPWVWPFLPLQEVLILFEDFWDPLHPLNLHPVVLLPPLGFLEVIHQAAIWMIRQINFFGLFSIFVMLKLETRIPRLYLSGSFPISS